MDIDDSDRGEGEARVIPIRGEDDAPGEEEGPGLPGNPELDRAMEEALASLEKKGKKASGESDAAELAQEERESLQGRIRDLHLKMMEKDREIEQLKDQTARWQANLENYKRRVQKEKANQFNYGNEEIAREFLEVLDNLERALAQGKTDPAGLLDGIELTRKLMEQTFVKFGVEPIEALGKPFDPSLHQAIAQAESPDHKPGTIIHEQQRGYMLKDRLLRPSMVVVAGASGAETSSE